MLMQEENNMRPRICKHFVLSENFDRMSEKRKHIYIFSKLPFTCLNVKVLG